MLTDAANIERWLVALLAMSVLPWSYRGVRELAQGKFWPPSFYLACVFWLGFSALSFELAHAAAAFGAPRDTIECWRLVNFTTLAMSLLCAFIGHRRGDLLRARRFYRLYDHLGEAMAIAELTALDPERGRQIADECRVLAAEAMVTSG